MLSHCQHGGGLTADFGPDVVYCHDCSREWYYGDHDEPCPGCQDEAVEDVRIGIWKENQSKTHMSHRSRPAATVMLKDLTKCRPQRPATHTSRTIKLWEGSALEKVRIRTHHGLLLETWITLILTRHLCQSRDTGCSWSASGRPS